MPWGSWLGVECPGFCQLSIVTSARPAPGQSQSRPSPLSNGPTLIWPNVISLNWAQLHLGRVLRAIFPSYWKLFSNLISKSESCACMKYIQYRWEAIRRTKHIPWYWGLLLTSVDGFLLATISWGCMSLHSQTGLCLQSEGLPSTPASSHPSLQIKQLCHWVSTLRFSSVLEPKTLFYLLGPSHRLTFLIGDLCVGDFPSFNTGRSTAWLCPPPLPYPRQTRTAGHSNVKADGYK